MGKLIKKINIICVFVSYILLVIFEGFSVYCKNHSAGVVFSVNDENITNYAKALNNCVLYKSVDMVDGFEDVYFQVPETYFVMIIESINDECYKVQYDKYVGYIKSSSVVVATFVPIVKTLENVKFDIKNSSGTQIWQAPTTNSSICTTISAGVRNITYIASAVGAVPSGGKSNVWYYVHYTPSQNSTNVYEGYIYSENTTNLSEIVANLESNPVDITKEQNTENLVFISSTIKTIILVVILVPIILFFAIILYKIVKKYKKTTIKAKNNNIFQNENYDDFAKNENIKSLEKFKNLKLVKNKHLEPNYNNFNDDELL